MTSDGLDIAQAKHEYIEARIAYEAASDKADAAFTRYFTKLNAGEPTNGAQANRLANEASYLSADLYSAEAPLYALDIEPDEVWKDRP